MVRHIFLGEWYCSADQGTVRYIVGRDPVEFLLEMTHTVGNILSLKWEMEGTGADENENDGK